jgi:hypothetical protein
VLVKSKIELASGDIVPIPTCALKAKLRAINKIEKNFFIVK